MASAAKPDTILAWFRKLVAHKFDGSRHRRYPGRPPLGRNITELIVRLARENSGWGYDRIAGALEILGHRVSDQTVGNILRRFGIPPASKTAPAGQLGRLHSFSYGRAGRHRFLHRRSAHLARLGNLLCTVLPPLGDAPRHPGWNHQTSHRRLDGADGSPGCRSDRRRPAPDPLLFCMTATRSSALRFETRFVSRAFARSLYRLAAQI